MTTNETFEQILKTQDINALMTMIDTGVIALNNFDLFDVLVHFINNNDEKADVRFIKFLINNGIKLDHSSKRNNTQLMLLAYLGLDELVDDFISKGFDINVQNGFGMNAFHWAVAGGQYTTVKLLIEKGADIHAKIECDVEVSFAEDGIPIIYSDEEKPEIKKILFSSFALAFNTYNPKIIKLLLEKGFDPNENVISNNMLFDFFGDKPVSEYHINNNAFTMICKKNDTELLKLMIEKGANEFATSELAEACKNLNFDMIRLLVEAGVDINFDAFSKKGFFLQRNPLSILCYHSAVEPINGNCATGLSIHGDEVFEIIKYLVDHGADVNINSPLMEACKIKDYENKAYADINLNIIQYLIDKGADVNHCDHQGKNILMYATKAYNSFELVKLLIESGADVNHKDDFGNTVIMNIALDAQYEEMWLTNEEIDGYKDEPSLFDPEKILLYLINNGANINAKNSLGMTALMHFSWKNNPVFVKILLEHGADINAKSEMTAFDLAKYEEIKALIQKTKNNNPQKLIKLLKNFTIDKPIKYTTHDWELFHPINSEYQNFDGYMEAVKKQFDGIKSELEELSPNLYKKIYTFLIEENPDENYSWCHKAHINIGWSSLKGLKEHCDAGKKAENFVLAQAIVCEIDFRRTRLTTFKDIVNLFKQEIEIRENFRNLETLFTTYQEELGDTFIFDLSGAKLTRQFYIDVEKFSGTLSKIFKEIKTRNEFPNILVTTQEIEEDRSIVLKITQIDSFSHCDAQGLLDEGKDGDFAEIKENLKNLCDWSVESSFGENAFRVNYLYSNNVKEIELLREKPKGFTHILRFYK